MNKTTNKSEADKRKYKRIEKQYILKCEQFTFTELLNGDANIPNEAITKNFSAGGLLFQSTQKFNIGDLLKIEVDLKGWDKFKHEFYKVNKTSNSSPLTVLANVVRVEMLDNENKNYDIGVCISAIDDGHKIALKEYVDHLIQEQN